MSSDSSSPATSDNGNRSASFLWITASIVAVVVVLGLVLYILNNQRDEQFWASQTALSLEDERARGTQTVRPTSTLEQIATDWAGTQAVLATVWRTATAAAETQWAEPYVTAEAQTATAAPGVTASAATQQALSQATDKAATATLGALATTYATEQYYQDALRFIEQGYWFQAQDALEKVLDGDPNYKDAEQLLARVMAEIEASAGKEPTPRTAAYHWLQRNPVNVPSPRLHYGMVYDTLRAVTVLFGGSSAGALQADTWEWDGERWWPLSPPNSPPARQGAVMVFDPSRSVSVLFGGQGLEGDLGDTWEYKGDWSAQTFEEGSAPSARAYSCAAYDRARSQLLMFGGAGAQGPTAETWSYDGVEWQLLETVDSPSARTGCKMVYDPGDKAVILFGGRAGARRLSDTWRWDGVSWSQVETSLFPPARADHGMVYHTRLGRIMLFGGENGACAAYQDTWVWDGQAWTSLEVGKPGPHAAFELVYEPSANATLFFSGSTLSAGVCTQQSDTWELVLR